MTSSPPRRLVASREPSPRSERDDQATNWKLIQIYENNRSYTFLEEKEQKVMDFEFFAARTAGLRPRQVPVKHPGSLQSSSNLHRWSYVDRGSNMRSQIWSYL